jgi:Mor family transcriptional regulator
MSLPERSADFVLQLLLHVEENLIGFGVDKDNAEKMATEICDELRNKFGKEYIYFAGGRKTNSIMKHHAIYKAFTGNNHAALGKEFGVSTPHVYRVIKIASKEEMDKRQPQLPF